MTKHLLPETIEQFERHQLTGEVYVEVLLHLNSCAGCRQKLAVPNQDEVLKRLFEDDEPKEPEKTTRFGKIKRILKRIFGRQ